VVQPRFVSKIYYEFALLVVRPSRGGRTHGNSMFCQLLLDLAAFHLAVFVHPLIYNAFASVDNFAGLLKHGISATQPVICSFNSSFVANDSWS